MTSEEIVCWCDDNGLFYWTTKWIPSLVALEKQSDLSVIIRKIIN